MSSSRPPSDLVRDLLRPEHHPAPRPREVSLRTTHISWVFLTEETAYKVKRPVNLGFLDFSTVGAREHYCHEEVRLNAALAPKVYLGVVPIRHDEAGFRLSGDGQIVEHAVKMRRLPDQRSANALLAAGALTSEHLAALAERLAAFYVAAPVAPDMGGADAMTTNLEENLEQLAAFAGDPLDPSRLAEVAAAQRRDLARLRGTMDERTAAGRVREGHGDLRLEHVYFLDDDPIPLVIDRLEFSQRFRVGDVALDVAFLVMELHAAGAASSAEYFLYQFARATADFGQYALTDFYACYRALVRTKIACLLSQDPSTPSSRAALKRTEAARLLGLAYATALGAPKPLVVIAIGGLVAAGKSTLAEGLARRFGLPVISSDVARKQLAGVSLTDRGPATLYEAANHAPTYEEVFRRASYVLGSGRGVVLDATFRTPHDRARARQLAHTHGARFLFVHAVCDEQTLRERLHRRASQDLSVSDADESVLDRIASDFVAPNELPVHEVLVCQSADPAAMDSIAERVFLPTRDWPTS
jgi:aminoglycoside phosphotransferase family enzyme/predicted kinase